MRGSLSRIVGVVLWCVGIQWTTVATAGVPSPAATPTIALTPGGDAYSLQGSWAGLSLLRALTVEFERQPDGGVIPFHPRSSTAIVPLLARNRLEMGVVLDCLVPGADRELGLQFEKRSLGLFVVFVVVNAKNPTRRITLEELAQVYRGRIRSWQEISGSDNAGTIELYAPLVAKTEGCIFRRRVLKGSQYAEQLGEASTPTSRQKLTSDEVIQAVAKERNAIGFFLLGYEKELDKRVRVLGIAENAQARTVYPSVRTIKDGSYPLSDILSLYVHPDARPLAWQFCEFATGPEAAKIVKTYGLFPDYQWRQHVGRLRLAEMERGKGERITAHGTAAAAALMRDLAAEFVKAKTLVQLRYRPTSEAVAVRQFLRHGELLLTDGPLGKEVLEKYGRQWDAYHAQAVPVGRMAVGLVVHPANPVKTMSSKELAAVCTGRASSWSQWKGPAYPIRLYGLSAASPIDRLLREKLGIARLGARVIRRSDTAKVVAAVAKDMAAIGFVDLSALSPSDSSVRLLTLAPTAKPFAKRSHGEGDDYPLAKPYTLYVSPQASEKAQEFARFVALGHGADAIRRSGLVPSVAARRSVNPVHNPTARRR